MDARIRNLVAMGKRVFVTGDLNISMGQVDAAHAIENIRKGVITEDDFVTAPARRLFNHLLSDGKVVGERDEGRERPVLFDICRSFHSDRKGMYTCWEQRINARPGNYGSRIDYVLCSLDMQDWFCESNIQEGLMGSDHCPVYAMFKDTVHVNGEEASIYDIMNPPGMFQKGERKQEYTMKLLLPLSGRLIPEFDRRRNIKDMFMFTRKPSQTAPKVQPSPQSTTPLPAEEIELIPQSIERPPTRTSTTTSTGAQENIQPKANVRKRPIRAENSTVKRSKSMNAQAAATKPGQSTLKGFFKPKSTPSIEPSDPNSPAGFISSPVKSTERLSQSLTKLNGKQGSNKTDTQDIRDLDSSSTSTPVTVVPPNEETNFIDPITNKEDWTKLFTKKPPPKCEGHEEECISLKTKKPGVNFGRTFWICPRPLGPSGNKEKGTAWRCPTFIWANDWDPSTM
ncbi:Putative DNA lyase (Fragment) [Aspergillus calidoustus]|uniref:DNA-(apurinic or apyrimidinic site) endonuclease 2 n=1 Tax=Aspergillus calidoustus TaxID=454130 RepID=A0A0U5GBE9_ASPCI